MAIQVKSLPDDAESIFAEVREKYIARGLSTEPADRASVEDGIRRCYACAGLVPPSRIVWVESPIVGALTVAELLGNSAVDSAVDSAVGSAVYRAVGGRLWLSYQSYLHALRRIGWRPSPKIAEAIDAYESAQQSGTR